MKIQNISQKIFRTNTTEKIKKDNNHSNPFGLNFKGNIISADVFASGKSIPSFKGIQLAAEIAGKCKLAMRNTRDSISGWTSIANTRFGKRLNAVKDFGIAIREKAGDVLKYLNTKSLYFNIGIKNKENIFAISKTQKPKPVLAGKTVEALEPMFEAGIAKELAAAA